MKGKKNLLILFSCVLTVIIAGLFACTRSAKEIIPSSEYAPYVNAYTGGVISQSSPIRIELTQDQPMVDLNNELKDCPFSFTPSLKGKAYWVSNNTIEFLPEEGELKPGKLYQGSFQLGDFVEVDSKLKVFDFSFRRASARSCSLTSGPRLVLIKMALGFISSRRRVLTRSRVDSVSGQCRLTISHSRKIWSSSAFRISGGSWRRDLDV